MIRSGERAGDRPDRPQASVRSVAAHARLLHKDDVGAHFALDVVAQPQTIEHAGREALRDNVGNGDETLRNFQALRVPNVERNAALAGILVVVLAAHIQIGDPGKRRRRRLARLPAADWRHCGEARVGIFLPFDLDAFGAQRRREPRAAGGGKKPGKVEDAHILQWKRTPTGRTAPAQPRAAWRRQAPRPSR